MFGPKENIEALRAIMNALKCHVQPHRDIAGTMYPCLWALGNWTWLGKNTWTYGPKGILFP